MITDRNIKSRGINLVQNNYFDEVWGIQLNKPLPPKQSSAKSKNREFEKLIHSYLTSGRQISWPIQQRVFISLLISGPKHYINRADIDNIAKQVLDSIKIILIKDDRQVFHLKASKRESVLKFLSFGIRILKQDDEKIDFNQPLHFRTK